MCLPHPNESAAPANQVPTLQDASNLTLGGAGAPRGSADLGRLALRLNQSDPPAAPAPAALTSPPVASPEATPPGSTTATPGVLAPNPGLRLGSSQR